MSDLTGERGAGYDPRNKMAEAFIRGFQAGAERPEDGGDGDAMYQAFRDWYDRCRRCEAPIVNHPRWGWIHVEPSAGDHSRYAAAETLAPPASVGPQGSTDG